METSVGLSDWAAGRSERRGALFCALAFVAFAVAITPFASRPLGSAFPLFAMVLSAAVVGNAVTALLLLVQARALGSVPTAVLATGFGFAGAVLAVYALIYPGMLPELTAMLHTTTAANGMLWFLWHAGLLVAVLGFYRVRRFPRGDALRVRRARATIIALAALYVVVVPASLWLPFLPTTFEHGRWTWFYTLVQAPTIAVLALAALWASLRWPRATVLDLWLGVVSLAMLLDVYLTVLGGTRFTLAWWASRIEMVIASTAILGVLLSQTARMYAAVIERAEILEGEAHTDMLTGMPNRRRFDEELARAFGSALRRASPLSIAVVDIDRFKAYNDAFGHQAGDDALHRIATAILDSVDRSGDFAARYGGEEFVVILEDTSLDGAIAVAERIRNSVLEAGISAPGGGLLSVSAGVASRYNGERAVELLRRADEALYEAKNGGRNRVAANRVVVSESA